uniref:Uncharacterized protein n=1 Tax=viral metagenome TaxID=1070528 RepID=A0A6H1ZQE8_9ZZZZ
MTDSYWLDILDKAKARKVEKAQNRTARLLKQADRILEYNHRKKHRKSKKARQSWWNSLTSEQRSEYISALQVKKAEKRAKTGFQSTCTVFPVVDETNRANWLDKIHAMNPWMPI